MAEKIKYGVQRTTRKRKVSRVIWWYGDKASAQRHVAKARKHFSDRYIFQVVEDKYTVPKDV